MADSVICYLIVNKRTLLVKGKYEMDKGYLVPPSGPIIEPETSLDCIKREFQDQTGLTLVKPELDLEVAIETKVFGGKNTFEYIDVYTAKDYEGIRPKAAWCSENNLLIFREQQKEVNFQIFSYLGKPEIQKLFIQRAGTSGIKIEPRPYERSEQDAQASTLCEKIQEIQR